MVEVRTLEILAGPDFYVFFFWFPIFFSFSLVRVPTMKVNNGVPLLTAAPYGVVVSTAIFHVADPGFK